KAAITSSLVTVGKRARSSSRTRSRGVTPARRYFSAYSGTCSYACATSARSRRSWCASTRARGAKGRCWKERKSRAMYAVLRASSRGVKVRIDPRAALSARRGAGDGEQAEGEDGEQRQHVADAIGHGLDATRPSVRRKATAHRQRLSADPARNHAS